MTYGAFKGTLPNMVAVQDALLSQMRRGTLQYCVLALLAKEERYGFDLVRGLADVDGMVTSERTIYPLLSRLRRDGLVESSWQESTAGPPRRYYRLTDAGRTASRGSGSNGPASVTQWIISSRGTRDHEAHDRKARR